MSERMIEHVIGALYWIDQIADERMARLKLTQSTARKGARPRLAVSGRRCNALICSSR